MFEVVKRLFVGRPLATTQMDEQKLTKKIALAIFSSDALSSTAYATEEILFVTAVGASSLAVGLSYLVPIAIVVAILLFIVTVSYRQIIFAYPDGGGAYKVSQDNIGEMASLVAGASLMVDYILTVAVSICAGVAAIVSIPAFAGLADQRVLIGVVLIVLITLGNMRGIKESGRLFAIPTYVYLVVITALLGWGLYKSYFGTLAPVPHDPKLFENLRESGGSLTVFFLLKGFSSGAVALTGVEAISNGVPAFRRPSPKNAAATLVAMAVILGTLFFGISVLAHRLQPFPSEKRTVIAQLGLAVWGNGPTFLLLQFSTALILTLAANTAYNGFPSLTSIIARDGYLPRQLANRGDRLVFSNGIVVLAGSAAALLVAFGGVTTNLIPLYAVGVFTSFTLSQFGMVRFHLRHRERAWRRSTVLNFVGGTATLAVLSIVAFTKFTSGAWVPIIVIPLIVVLFKAIKRHYVSVSRALDVPEGYRPPRRKHAMVVLSGAPNAGTIEAIAYARSVAPDHLVAMTVVHSPEDAERAEKRWSAQSISVPLEIVNSPARAFAAAALGFIDDLTRRWENTIVTVVIPEVQVEHWWQQALHNQTALMLKGRLLFHKNVVVTSIPYQLDGRGPAETPVSSP